MRDRFRDRTELHAEALQKALADSARTPVAFDTGHQHDIVLHIRLCDPVLYRYVHFRGLRQVLVGNGDDGASSCAPTFRRNLEILFRQGLYFDRVLHMVGIHVFGQVDQQFSLIGDHLAVQVYGFHVHLSKVVDDGDIGFLARRQHPDIGESEVGHRVDRRHLNGFDGVDPFVDRALDDLVHVPKVLEIRRNHVVGRQDTTSGVHAVFGDRADAFGHILLGGTLAHEEVNALLQLFYGFGFISGLVTGALSTGADDVRGELIAKEFGGVSVDDLPELFRV